MKIRWALPLALLVVSAASLFNEAHAVTGDAEWRMEEAVDATVMLDSTSDHDGSIGRRVTLTGHAYVFPGATPATQGGAGAYQPGRLVQVPEDNALDPMNGAYSVALRFKMPRNRHEHTPNVIQKGQANQPGGYWKLAISHGWPRCHFRDADGNTAAVGFVHGLTEYKVNDSEWHTLTCERLADGRSRVTLDGTVRTSRSTTGTLNNARPLVIGGKLDCASDTTGCDYANVKIRWVTVTH